MSALEWLCHANVICYIVQRQCGLHCAWQRQQSVMSWLWTRRINSSCISNTIVVIEFIWITWQQQQCNTQRRYDIHLIIYVSSLVALSMNCHRMHIIRWVCYWFQWECFSSTTRNTTQYTGNVYCCCCCLTQRFTDRKYLACTLAWSQSHSHNRNRWRPSINHSLSICFVI